LATAICFTVGTSQARALSLDTPLVGVNVGSGDNGLDVGVSVPAAGTDINANVGGGDQGVSVNAEVNTPAANVNVGVGGAPSSSEKQSNAGSSGSSSSGESSAPAASTSNGGSSESDKTSKHSSSRGSASKSEAPGTRSLRRRSAAQGATDSLSNSPAAVTGLVDLVAQRSELPSTLSADAARQNASVVAQLVSYIPTWIWILLGLLTVSLLGAATFGWRERRKRGVALRMAMLDPLTEIANVKAFDERLAQEWARSRRYGGALGILMIDLDRFKQVNDEHGHAVGDRVLIATANELRAHTRASDLVARVGGDEFAVICPETSLKGLERLREELEAELTRGVGYGVGVSIGVAELCAEDESVSALLARADTAMYSEKSSHHSAEGSDAVLVEVA
jgi:diguanylate cyclase (GGDEF)-like protein